MEHQQVDETYCCLSCGGSFDATRECHCPFCSREYHLEEDDWTVIKIQKR